MIVDEAVRTQIKTVLKLDKIPHPGMVQTWLVERGWYISAPLVLLAPYADLRAIPDDQFMCLLFLIHEHQYAYGNDFNWNERTV